MGRYPFALRRADPGDLKVVRGLVREAAEGHGFSRRAGRDPRELAGYPSQALFERHADQAGDGCTGLFTQ